MTIRVCLVVGITLAAQNVVTVWMRMSTTTQSGPTIITVSAATTTHIPTVIQPMRWCIMMSWLRCGL